MVLLISSQAIFHLADFFLLACKQYGSRSIMPFNNRCISSLFLFVFSYFKKKKNNCSPLN